MPLLTQPPGDGPFDKPGRDWTPEERRRVAVWLNTPPQIGLLVRYTAHHLGTGTTSEDAEETWASFVADELNRTIDLYDPARGPFPGFLLMRLRQFAWRRGDQIRRRREESLVQQDAGGDPIELEVVDPRATREQDVIDRLDLERCMASMPPAWRTVFLSRQVEGRSTPEAAVELGLTEANVKVRLFRAIRWLRKCLVPDENKGPTPR